MRWPCWVSQLNRFTRFLSTYCSALVPRPVAVAVYFDTKVAGDVGPVAMGSIVARFLEGTDVSIVMFEDSVGKENIAAADVKAYVSCFLAEVAKACRTASTLGDRIHLWLDVESYTYLLGDDKYVPTNIRRLIEQLRVGEGFVEKRVTFDFPDYLGRKSLYADYRALVRTE
jgi:hypothetical protein